ncbi:MAG: hypothetical protein GC137_02080 [Alphaproteobacteria bacterium]|nr:hypothetical protein [Alphaproteobacteria bacterium]
MFALANKPEMGARFYSALIQLAADHERGIDSMKVILHMAGVLVETYYIFDDPDEAMQASFKKLAQRLRCHPAPGHLAPYAMPPADITDQETERGRLAARIFFEEWLDCNFELHELILEVFQNVIVSWEEMGMPREETFRLLIESVKLCMAYEISAQELCDLAIETQIGYKNWSIGDCIAALSGVAGRRLAISLGSDEVCNYFRGVDLPQNLDRVVHSMIQEAVRLGVPAGTDWRFGLAANDTPINAPVDLVRDLEPQCLKFFRMIKLTKPYDQAVACAKASGRMIAVASGGELPEIEPAIAKPLAMSAITESYKYVCLDFDLASG